MEIFLNLWNNWTNTEKIHTLTLFISLMILIPLLVLYISRNKKLFIFTISSLISSAILTLIGILFLNVVFNLTITYIFLLTPIIVLFINLLNIGTCLGYHELHKKQKHFNFIELKKEYIRDSIYLSIFILLLFSAFSVFLSSTFLVFIILSTVISIAVVWANYALLYYIVK
jgi:pheromone shutdown protein TraB